MGVPISTEKFQRGSVKDSMRGKNSTLIRALARLEDAYTCDRILRLSAVSSYALPARDPASGTHTTDF